MTSLKTPKIYKGIQTYLVYYDIKKFSKHVMAFGSSQTMQRNQIFSMINFIGTLSLFFTLNLKFVHHPLIVLLSGQNINLDLFYDKKMLTKNERSKQFKSHEFESPSNIYTHI
jgi:hypothetical protein